MLTTAGVTARSHRFGCLVKRQKGSMLALLIGVIGLSAAMCGMDMLVTEDKRSSRDSENQSHVARRSAWACS